MRINGSVYCLFEQSGTFKSQFQALGVPAYDYDIQNEFGETDNVLDIFCEIEKGFDNEPSIFDKMTAEDLIMAFFPCTFFCEGNVRLFRFEGAQYRLGSHLDSVKAMLERESNRSRFWGLLLKLFCICDVRGLRLIVENPYATQHYLVQYFPYRAAVIDHDRSKRGDLFKKPTQYWFVNCTPTNGHTFSPAKRKPLQSVPDNRKRKKIRELKKQGIHIGVTGRSAISKVYAYNFICDFILGIESKYNTQPNLF